jgi:hypothetical protein
MKKIIINLLIAVICVLPAIFWYYLAVWMFGDIFSYLVFCTLTLTYIALGVLLATTDFLIPEPSYAVVFDRHMELIDYVDPGSHSSEYSQLRGETRLDLDSWTLLIKSQVALFIYLLRQTDACKAQYLDGQHSVVASNRGARELLKMKAMKGASIVGLADELKKCTDGYADIRRSKLNEAYSELHSLQDKMMENAVIPRPSNALFSIPSNGNFANKAKLFNESVQLYLECFRNIQKAQITDLEATQGRASAVEGCIVRMI